MTVFTVCAVPLRDGHFCLFNEEENRKRILLSRYVPGRYISGNYVCAEDRIDSLFGFGKNCSKDYYHIERSFAYYILEVEEKSGNNIRVRNLRFITNYFITKIVKDECRISIDSARLSQKVCMSYTCFSYHPNLDQEKIIRFISSDKLRIFHSTHESKLSFDLFCHWFTLREFSDQSDPLITTSIPILDDVKIYDEWEKTNGDNWNRGLM